jgi:hypothetical protein
MHIATLGMDFISIYTQKPENSTTVSLHGIELDRISKIEELQATVSRLIEKHESDYKTQIEEVHIICEILEYEVIKVPKLHNAKITGKTITNSFQMKTCKIYEAFNEADLKALINCFLSIGVNVGKVFSFFSTFTHNAKNMIESQKVALLHIGKNITLYTFDGAGSLKDIYKINKGLHDIIQYISLSTIAKFPHLTKRAVILILQNFICFNELDMIEKIHNIKGVNKELMAVVNYETVKFVSTLLTRYLRQIWADINPPQEMKNIVVHTQKEFAENIKEIIGIITADTVIKMQKIWLAPEVEYNAKKERTIFAEIKRIFFTKYASMK